MTASVFTVGLIVGSASHDSLNRRYADALRRIAPEAGLDLVDIPIAHLPFYGTQYDREYPEVGVDLKRAIDEVDGLLIVTPEYNRSIPAVLKNAIDWATRPGGKSSLAGVPTAVTGASKGAVSTAVAQAHLKSILSALGVPLVGVPEAYIRVDDGFFAEDGSFAREGTSEFLTGFLSALHDLIARWR